MLNTSKRRLHFGQHTLCIFAALLLFVSQMSHMHIRYCLDGDGPLVSVHIESPAAHDEHDDHSDNTADIETELSIDTIVGKYFSDSQLDSYIAINELPNVGGKSIKQNYGPRQTAPPLSRAYATPLLRAPPHLI